MAARTGTAHVVTTTRKYKDQVYRTHLLRRSYREGGTVKNETLGNLSHLPEPLIEIIRRSLQGETFVPLSSALEIVRSRPHGHVQAVALAMQRLGLASLVASKPCRERDLVLAMVALRVVEPTTKLATAGAWHCTTLAEEFGVADAHDGDLYAAMDWLVARQNVIQKKLAARHLREGGLVLYNLSSSYLEGACCPLTKRGHSRLAKTGTLKGHYGLLTDPRGCPVAVSVLEGNTSDGTTFLSTLQQLREDLGVAHVATVGDRGMVSQKDIEEMRKIDGVSWITALTSGSIHTLVEQGQLQMDLVDERNLLEISSPQYPGERLVAYRNGVLAKLCGDKREALLAAAEDRLAQIKVRVDTGKLSGQDVIGAWVGEIIDQHKMAKHLELHITGSTLSWTRKADSIANEAALDGLYAIRSSVPAAQMGMPESVRSYKSLAEVERAFRLIKPIDLLADRVGAHTLLCMLAYYVEWHMREAWRPLMFADPEQFTKTRRDLVAPAQGKASTLLPSDGTPAQSFAALMGELATVVRNTCRAPSAGSEAPTFEVITTTTPWQQSAMDLVNAIRP